MKTTNRITKEFVREIKNVLDNATWGWESSGHFRDESGVEKACNYLNGQRFSVKKISEALQDNWETIVEMTEELDHDGMVEFAAAHLAMNLAYDRISPYAWTNRFESTSGKWYIDESVTFTIK